MGGPFVFSEVAVVSFSVTAIIINAPADAIGENLGSWTFATLRVVNAFEHWPSREEMPQEI